MSLSNAIFAKLTALTTLGTSITGRINSLALSIRDHVLDVDNPHGLTKGHVGLSRVENMAPATRTQAVNGTNNNTVLTPDTMGHSLQTNVLLPLKNACDAALTQLDS